MNFLPIAAVLILILPIVLIAVLIKRVGKRLEFFEYMVLSAGSVLLSILLCLRLYYWLKGQSVFDVIWNSIRQAFLHGPVNAGQMLAVYHEWGLFQNFTSAEQLADFMIGQIQIMVPAIILLSSLIYGGILFLLIRLIFKNLSIPAPAVPAFEDWTLPRRAAVSLILLPASFLIINMLGIANVEAAQLAVTVLASFVFSVMGMSVLGYFLKAGRVPSVLRWLLLILAYALFGFFLTLLGIVDQFLHLRIRYRNKFRITNGG